MFLDISFIGGAGYRVDGYSKIYSSWRKQRRRSICIEEDNSHHFAEYKLSENYHCDENNNRKRNVDNLNVSLPYFSSDRKSENLNRKYKKSLSRSMAKYRNYYNTYDIPEESRYCESCCCCNKNDVMLLNKVSFWGNAYIRALSLGGLGLGP